MRSWISAGRPWRRVRGRQAARLLIGAALAGAAFMYSASAILPAPAPAMLPAPAPVGDEDELVAQGELFFRTDFTPEQGLGPLFNASSCLACHNSPVPGGMGTDGLGVAVRTGRLIDQGFDPLREHGGPLARARSVAEFGPPCRLRPGIPATANVTSVRNAPPLFGLGLIDAIPDEVILAGAVPRGDGVHGRPNIVTGPDGRPAVGRFGWKADTATLAQFVAEAYRNELGITNPLAPADLIPAPAEDDERCAGEAAGPEDDGTIARATTAFVASLVAPVRPAEHLAPAGAAIFRRTGCAACHVPSLRAGDQEVPLYSDLLLHDMGPALDDGVPQGQATGRDWRTTPLWGLGDRVRYLHDGRARTIPAAILAHGGEAEQAVQRFRKLTADERAALLAFLAAL